MRRHTGLSMVAVILMLGLATLAFSGCSRGAPVSDSPQVMPAADAGANASPGTQPGVPTTGGGAAGQTGITGSGQVAPAADAAAINAAVQQELEGLEADLDAIGPDTPIDPDQATSGF